MPRGTKITLLGCSVHIVSNMEIQDAVQQDEGLVLRVVDVRWRFCLRRYKSFEHGERPAGLRTG